MPFARAMVMKFWPKVLTMSVRSSCP